MPFLIAGGQLTGFAFETLTVSSVSLAATAATYLASGTDTNAPRINAEGLLLAVETNPIRVRWDAVAAPTAAVGMLLNPGDTLELSGIQNIKNLRMIRQGASDATVMITYVKR